MYTILEKKVKNGKKQGSAYMVLQGTGKSWILKYNWKLDVECEEPSLLKLGGTLYYDTFLLIKWNQKKFLKKALGY